jgi:hypothetical protein
MAEAVRRWLLALETGFNSGWLQVRFVVDEVALEQVFLPCFRFSPANQLLIIPSLLHAHLSLPHEVCDSPDQAAHYSTCGLKLGASSLIRHFAGLGVKAVQCSTV